MDIIVYVVVAIIALGVGAAVGYYYYRRVSQQKVESADVLAKGIIAKAEAKSKELEIQSKEEAIRLRSKAEKELQRKRQELDRHEERLQKRQESLDKRFENIERRERNLNKRQSQIDRRANEIDKLNQERIAELERISSMIKTARRNAMLFLPALLDIRQLPWKELKESVQLRIATRVDFTNNLHRKVFEALDKRLFTEIRELEEDLFGVFVDGGEVCLAVVDREGRPFGIYSAEPSFVDWFGGMMSSAFARLKQVME